MTIQWENMDGKSGKSSIKIGDHLIVWSLDHPRKLSITSYITEVVLKKYIKIIHHFIAQQKKNIWKE